MSKKLREVILATIIHIEAGQDTELPLLPLKRQSRLILLPKIDNVV